MRRRIERFCGEPPPADGLPESMAELTARELEVLKLVARGLSNRQIGESLFLSEATVKTHLAHVDAKLNVRDRVHAVLLATAYTTRPTRQTYGDRHGFRLRALIVRPAARGPWRSRRRALAHSTALDRDGAAGAAAPSQVSA